MKTDKFIPLIGSLAIFASLFFSHSCANTTSAPSGGPKDTIPPDLIAVSPLPGELNVPVKNTKIIFTFNEYVAIKDQKNIYLSPPMEKPLKATTKGKSVVVSFEEELLPNTTYTIDITGAIADNNEGNPFAGYALTFSTGDKIDSMYVTGLVQDCSTLKPVKGATVMLYKDQRDSAIFLSRPNAAVKTDEWGFFCLRNIQDTCFRLYALVDENNNNMYESETERVAFCDSVITPVNKVGKDIYELYKFDMLDTAACLKRKTEYELNLFKGVPRTQMIVNKERVDERTTYITFMAPDAQVLSLKYKGISDKKIITQFNARKDSLVMWINDPKKLPDTLYLNVKYMKTDSLGVLQKTDEKIKFAMPKSKGRQVAKSSRRNINHEDTIAVYKVNCSPETFEQYGIEMEFNYPLITEGFDSIRYEITNPRQKTEKGKFVWEADSSDIRKYHIRHVGRLLKGYEYKFTIPHRRFRDLTGFWNDSTVTSIKLPDDDKLSSLKAVITGVEGKRYIIDMMTEKRDNVIRGYTIENDCTLDFPYLKANKYCIRITEDRNRNNMVDTGDLLSHKQPEKVRFYKLKDGNFLIDIMESVEIQQDINLKELFR